MRERLAQLRQAFIASRRIDPRLVPWVVGAGAVGLVVGVGLGLLLGSWIWAVVFAPLLAASAAMIVFGRRSQRAQLDAIAGEAGAAAAVLNSMRGQWFVTPAIAFSRKQDLVHRVVGRPGVILVGEGSPARVKQLLAQERRRLQRVTGDVSVHTMIVGEAEGQVSLHKLTLRLTKLPRELKKTEVPRLERKLAPLDRDMPIPKGYMPNPGKKQR